MPAKLWRTDRQRRFWRGGILLSLTAVVMRLTGLAFNVYLTGKLGGEGMGLITLILSVYGFAVTFATSGIQLSATRMVAGAMGRDSHREVRQAMLRCNLYALAFGTVAMGGLYFAAPVLAGRVLGDPSLTLSLRILSPALPCIALSASMNGYFVAVRRVHKSAVKTLFEQGVKLSVTAIGLQLLLPQGIGAACCAVVGGSCFAEVCSFLLSFVLYRRDLRRQVSRRGKPAHTLWKELWSIALPVACTAYVRSGLLTLEHMLIPWGLTVYCGDRGAALSDYGCVQSMALPVVLFPLGILASFTGLLIPEFSEAQARGDREELDRLAGRSLTLTLRYAVATAVLLSVFAMPLGALLFPESAAGRFILGLSPLVPVMYFDSAVDAVLKGLGEQVYSMKVNILDAAVSVLLVAVLLPVTGIVGYLPIIWFTEWLNMLLSLRRVKKLLRFRLEWKKALWEPFCISGGGALIGRLCSSLFPFSPAFSLAFGMTVGGMLCLIGLQKTVNSGILSEKGCNLRKSVI